MNPSEVKPEISGLYEDNYGERKLLVMVVSPRPRTDGRDVQGQITERKVKWKDKEAMIHETEPQNYACSFGIFKQVWTKRIS